MSKIQDTEPSILQIITSFDENTDIDDIIIEFHKSKTVPTEFWVEFKDFLVQRKSDPTQFLLRLFDYSLSQSDLLLIAMCLRYGANPHAYVAVKKPINQNLHLLPRLYLKMRDTKSDKIIDTVVLMFMYFTGNVLNKRALDPSGGHITTSSQYFSERKKYESVGDWLINHGYTILKEYHWKGIEKIVPFKSIMIVNILVDSIETKNIPTDEFNYYIIKGLGNN